MASKKTKGKKVVDTCCPAVCDFKPRLYLDLEGQDVAQIKGLKVGDEGSFTVTGKIVGLEQRENTDSDGKKKTRGSIQLEGFEVEVLGSEDNEFKKLAEDDEDGD